jgi:hypothetical protein
MASVRDGQTAYTLPSAREAAHFHNKSVSVGPEAGDLSLSVRPENSREQASPSQANDYSDKQKGKRAPKVPDLKGNTGSHFTRNLSLSKRDEPIFNKQYGDHR